MIYFKRINETHITVTETGAVIKTAPESEIFVDPVSGRTKADAPFYYKEVSGDFVLAAKINLNFLFEKEEAFLLVMDHDRLWAKAGMQYSGKKGYTMVTSITNGYSDTAYGFHTECSSLWLKMIRKGDAFTVYYSMTGEEFYMVRQAKLPVNELVKAGIGVQSPEKEPQSEKLQDGKSEKGIGRSVSFEIVLLDQSSTASEDLNELSNFFG